MIASLEAAVRSRWPELGLAGEPDDLSFVLSSSAVQPHGHAFVHVLRAGEKKPLFVMKIPRDGVGRSRVSHEHDFLEELAEAAPGAAGRLFPRPLFQVTTANRLASARTLLPGTALDRVAARLEAEAKATQRAYDGAARWLRAFWRETGLLEGGDAVLWEDFLRSAHFCLHTLEPDEPGQRAIESFVRDVETRSVGSVLNVYGHGDLRASALIVAEDRTGALGWELGAKRQLPWVDPLLFALDWTTELGVRSGAGRAAGFVRAFEKNGELRDLTREFLEECFDEGGVPADDLRLALPAAALARLHRAIRAHGPTHPVTREWRAVAERCLRSREREAPAPPPRRTAARV